MYDRIKKDITEFPVFRFDWFFKSRTAQKLSRRCHTLPGMISKEYEDKVKEDQQKKSAKGARGTVRSLEYVRRRRSIYYVVKRPIRNARSPTSPMWTHVARRPRRGSHPRSRTRRRPRAMLSWMFPRNLDNDFAFVASHEYHT